MFKMVNLNQSVKYSLFISSSKRSIHVLNSVCQNSGSNASRILRIWDSYDLESCSTPMFFLMCWKYWSKMEPHIAYSLDMTSHWNLNFRFFHLFKRQVMRNKSVRFFIYSKDKSVNNCIWGMLNTLLILNDILAPI